MNQELLNVQSAIFIYIPRGVFYLRKYLFYHIDALLVYSRKYCYPYWQNTRIQQFNATNFHKSMKNNISGRKFYLTRCNSKKLHI